MLNKWHLGEKRYAYTEVSSALNEAFTITSATYNIYKCSDESLVVSGIANVSTHTVYALFEPADVDDYMVQFIYKIGLEDFSSKQIIEVRQTV